MNCLRFAPLLLSLVGFVIAGCGGESATPPKKSVAVKPPGDDAPSEPPPQSEPEVEEDAPPAENTGKIELHLTDSQMSFLVPPDWQRVKPENNIVEAEFALPHAEGDEFDGRLTLMSAIADRETIIGRRTSEFTRESGAQPVRDTITVGDVEATIVDVSGVWNGPDFKRLDQPREGYRMLFVIVPLGRESSFYAKLTGPHATIAAHEATFREFLTSAKFTR